MWPSFVNAVIARYALGQASSDDLVRWADQLLNAGIYTPALGELYSLHRWDVHWDNVAGFFQQAMSELGQPMPTEAEAARGLAGHYLVEIVEGRLAPREGVGQFMRGCIPLLEHVPTVPGGIEADLMRLCFTYDDYHPLDDLQARQAMDYQIDKLAQAWLHEHWASHIEAAWLTWNAKTVPAIAERIHCEHRFGDLPILADALEDAGCQHAEILLHLRTGGPHVRACWIVELITCR